MFDHINQKRLQTSRAFQGTEMSLKALPLPKIQLYMYAVPKISDIW